MARWKVAAVLIVVLVALLGVGITATVGLRPFFGPRARPLTDRTFEATPERLARGEYLARSVSGCFDCHSERDARQAGRPAVAGMEGAGRVWADEGTPWLVAPNITPDPETGSGRWSDDMIARAVREGIGHDGRTLFPIMPYGTFRHMSDEDLASVIVYLRSIRPVRKTLPASEIPFPLSRLINNEPQPLSEPVPAPGGDQVRQGEYLARIAACGDCHTPMNDRGQRLPGLEFAGGFTLLGPSGPVAALNLTPDRSGLEYYTEQVFVDVMRTGMVGQQPLNDVMPWAFYRGMTDDDLKAIFAYLKTLKPIKHIVDNTQAATLCPVCGLTHGGGDRNGTETTAQ